MKFNFSTDSETLRAIGSVSDILDFELGDGISVNIEKADRTSVTLSEGQAKICYRRKSHVFRGISLLAERIRRGEGSFEIIEDGFFESLSTMLDTSRQGVPTVATVKELIRYLAIMGYDTLLMYLEDMMELKTRPYFGYMRGRYTEEELREIDDFADSFGIEVVPCFEFYGHMEKYLIWPEAGPIRDTASVLLAREEATFEFLEEIVKTAERTFRSRRIHIGMDEAWDMGRGKFMDKHGYVPPFEIFTEFMERLVTITDRYGLTPMMWSDMYFRMGSENHLYYDENAAIPEDMKAKIPKNVELVYWHYGEAFGCDDYMLKKHAELERKVSYAGGNWGWVGHFPEHNYTMLTVRTALDACRKNGVRKVMLTIWTNDNAECNTFANLFDLSYFAENCFSEGVTEDELRSRFTASTGGDYDAFLAMSYYHNDFENGNDYPRYPERFRGKPLFWQDIMEGLYDTHLYQKPMSGHYSFAKDTMKKYSGGRWEHLYRFAELIFDYLAAKTEIAELLVPAYKSDDRATLRKIADELLPALKEKTVAVHLAHRNIWFSDFKVIGFANLDIRYSGVVGRCDTAMYLLREYLEGRLDTLSELDEPRLHKNLNAFGNYSNFATPNIKI